MLNPQIARQMRAYLEFMPRLTQAQQAAAANLGIFPRTGDIGTDDVRMAGARTTPQEQSGAQLEPVGPALGAQASAAQIDRPPPRRTVRRPRPTGDRLSDVLQRAQQRSADRTAEPAQVPQSEPVQARQNERSSQSPVLQSAETGPPQSTLNLPAQTSDSQPEILLPDPAPVEPARQPVDVAAAFGDFTLSPSATSRAASGGVDITRIEIPRERAEPEPSAHPARHWVQVATGKNREALAFDWRRIARQADGRLTGKGPFVTPWGEANRLLAGPYESASVAREMVNELKALGVDSFPFSSSTGEEIEPLD
jgi:hypothetical protein